MNGGGKVVCKCCRFFKEEVRENGSFRAQKLSSNNCRKFSEKNPKEESVEKDSNATSTITNEVLRVYKESQAASGFPNAKVQQIASSVLPVGSSVGSFVVVTFVVEKFMSPKSSPKTSSPAGGEGKSSSTQGVKWSIGAGTNLLQGFAAKVDREAKQRLNEFAKELRAFRTVDMSGCNFGDEGLFFLAESLGYNQVKASCYLPTSLEH
ncbi:Uncharacterized protein Rs2_01080 [Raphanus sativus]|nr:Uncharacterized protein Rs2_01080 [Raphanus sativus]